MTVSLILALLVNAGQSPQAPAPPVGQGQQGSPPFAQAPSAESSAADEAPTAPRDPAEVLVTTATAIILVPVKASLTADYEAAMTLLQGAFSSNEETEIRAVAAGWRVLRATEADSKGNVVYVHLLQPTVDGVDYRPSVWMDRLVEELPLDVLDRYRDSLAGPASLLSLTGVAAMSEPPATASEGGAAPATPSPDTGTSGTTGATPAMTAPVKRPGGPGR
ncbi:MAG: hypothetical protein FJW29_07450 [Acidobacteria bacterium]|nr:hypothetical protein [Acidobacteriota bacterium]